METELVRKSRAFSEGVFKNLPEGLCYHSGSHTAEVVKAAEEIGKHSSLTDDELESVLIAAWFHDIGFENGYAQHEKASSEKAEEQLSQWGASAEKIKAVQQAILSTQMPQRPISMVDKVLCDADLFHLSTEHAEKFGNLLRQELETTKGMKFTEEEWYRYNIQFMKGHAYFTTYGKTVLEERKKKNVKKIKKKLKPTSGDDYVKDLEKELDKLHRKLDKKANPERGIETMFRIASENHTTLSGMADTKSNIMISINSIILSVIVSVLFRKLEEFPNLLLPTLLLVLSCLATIVFAILATRPNISSGKFTKEDIKEKRTNLLFFGNFYGMELSNYEWGMREMMKDSDYLYSSLMKDLYFNGKVLARKYKLLRIAYSIFMFGFVTSIIAFIIALLMYYYPSNNLPI